MKRYQSFSGSLGEVFYVHKIFSRFLNIRSCSWAWILRRRTASFDHSLRLSTVPSIFITDCFKFQALTVMKSIQKLNAAHCKVYLVTKFLKIVKMFFQLIQDFILGRNPIVPLMTFSSNLFVRAVLTITKLLIIHGRGSHVRFSSMTIVSELVFVHL